MHTCETCGWYTLDLPHEDCVRGTCHHASSNSEFGIYKTWFCSNHTAYQRERDRMEIAKAAMGGLLANTEFRGGYHVHVEAAMMYADALMTELEKSK